MDEIVPKIGDVVKSTYTRDDTAALTEGLVEAYSLRMVQRFRLKDGRVIRGMEPMLETFSNVYKYENETMAQKAFKNHYSGEEPVSRIVNGTKVFGSGIRTFGSSFQSGRFVVFLTCWDPIVQWAICDDLVDRIADKYGHPVSG